MRRFNDKELRCSLEADELIFKDKESVTFNQFDAVHTMGERWCEVWIEVDDESRSLSE